MVTAIAWAAAKRANDKALSEFMRGMAPITKCDDTFAALLEAETALLAEVDAHTRRGTP